MTPDNITHYVENNFTAAYYSSIFHDNKLSQEARMLLSPVWKAEKSMRLAITNRINMLLYDNQQVVLFNFKKSMSVLWNRQKHEVKGAHCVVFPYNRNLRTLKVVLERDGRSFETEAMYVFGVNELIKFYEMIARELYQREDGPDRE